MITSSFIEALGWTLLHSLWQATLVVLAFLLVRPFLRKPTQVYWGGVGALLLIASWSVYTLVDLYVSEKAYTSILREASAPSAEVLPMYQNAIPLAESAPPLWSETVVTWVTPSLPIVVTGWLLGMLLLSVRMIGGLWYLSRLKRRGTSALPDIHDAFVTLINRLRLQRPVTLLASTLAHAPMVMGHLKPVILIPIGLINALPPEQIEAIIAHELAHVRRQDYWLNILQSVVEVVFFYHPAVWWISAVVREEREKCCDDLAVSLCGDTAVYARALAEAQAVQYSSPSLALAFSSQRKGLLGRIERLVQPRSSSGGSVAKALSVASVLLMITYLVMGDTLARKAEDGEQWQKHYLYPSSSSIAVKADTTSPTADTEKGWRGSAKAKALTAPAHQASPPPEDSATVTNIHRSSSQGFLFHFDSDDSTRFALSFDTNNLIDSSVYLHLSEGGPSGRLRRLSVYHQDTFPVFSWNDTLWHASMGELSEQMAGLSEELRDYLADSISTDALQAQLGAVRHELGQLQAELGLTLQRSFSEEHLEALQRSLRAEGERIREESERMQRAMERARERQAESRRQQSERRHEREERVHRNFDSTIDRLERSLLHDGLIEPGKEYRFELKPKGLYINRKKQDSRLLKKYRDLLQVTESTSFSITRTAE